MKTVETRLTALEEAVKAHDQRITALEARLAPKTSQQLITEALDALLDELEGQTEKEDA